MEPTHPEIPSFLGALRCDCGLAKHGPYCDGSHLDAEREGRRQAAESGDRRGEAEPSDSLAPGENSRS